MSLQLDALAAADCEKVFQDEISGAVTKRPGLDAALAALQPGDVLTVWRLDRSPRHSAQGIEKAGGAIDGRRRSHPIRKAALERT